VPGLAMSGVVPLSTVEDDFFVLDGARNLLVGRRTRRVIRLGDKVTVQVAKVDTFKKQVDFRLAVSGRSQTRPTSSRRTSSSRSGPKGTFAPGAVGRRSQPARKGGNLRQRDRRR